MKPVVFGEIMDFFAEGKPVMLAEPVVTDTTILDDDDEVVAMIKELLQERVSHPIYGSPYAPFSIQFDSVLVSRGSKKLSHGVSEV